MEPAERALRTLRSRHIRRIEFRYIGYSGIPIHVAPASFDRVATAVEHGTIQVVESPDLRAGNAEYRFNNSIDASGVARSGTLRFSTRGQSSRLFEAIIVHECVHASFDLTGSRLSLADDEAAAFLAGAIYCTLSGLPPDRWSGETMYEGMVRRTAREALRSATITSTNELDLLREAMIAAGYDGNADDPFPMGSTKNPSIYTHDR